LEEALGTGYFAHGFALGWKAGVVELLDDDAVAEAILDRSRAIMRKYILPSHLVFFNSTFDKVGHLERRGRFDEAARLLEGELSQVSVRAGNAHMMVAHAHSRLGFLREQTDATGAEQAFREALVIYADIAGTNSTMFAKAQFALGGVMMVQTRSRDGLAMMKAGVAALRQAKGAGPDVCRHEFELGVQLLWFPDQRTHGLKLMRNALEGLRSASDITDPALSSFAFQRSALLAAEGNFRDAFELMCSSLLHERAGLLKSVLGLTDSEALAHQRLKNWALRNSYLHGLLPYVGTEHIPSAVVLAAGFAGGGKAMSEEFFRLRNSMTEGGATVAEIGRTIRQKLRAMERESGSERSSTAPPSEHLKQLELAEAQLIAANQGIRSVMTSGMVNAETIVNSLPRDTLLVDFVRFRPLPLNSNLAEVPEQYAAYVLLPLPIVAGRSQIVRVNLGLAEPVDALCDEFQRLVAVRQIGERRLNPVLNRLYSLLIAPISAAVESKDHWLVSPIGQLACVPLEALRDPATGRHLIEDKRISYVSSGREVVRLAEPTASVPTNAPVVMGFPDFDLPLAAPNGGLAGSPVRPDSAAAFVAIRTPATLSRDARGHHFDPLPATEREARSAATLLGEDCVLRLGANAREAELKRVVSPRILHLATHGFYVTDQEFRATNSLPDLLASSAGPRFGRRPVNEDWENPLIRCGVALAGANHAGGLTNATAEDGILTGLEASLLQLQGTELVILSACQTGAGDVRIGEGVMSLRRAFTIAGAQSVLASHWRVSDEATSRLITEFLRHWRAGKPRVEALREAQLALLRSKEYSSPYFWAAFTLTGQWR
jgi:CHAT domain-containing protein